MSIVNRIDLPSNPSDDARIMATQADREAEQLQRAQAEISSGHFERALATVETILQDDPNNVDALYMKAVCKRYQRRHDEAFFALEELKSVRPDFGRAFQEEGHNHRELGNLDQALSAFQRASRANPALEASWRAQADLLKNAGRHDEAQQCTKQAERLSALPRELFAVTNFIHEGKFLKAENICRRYLVKNPHHVEAMRLLADIGTRLNLLDDAEFLLESACEFEPENVQVHLDYIQVLRKRQKFQKALQQAEKLHARDPDNPLFQSHLAIEALQTGDFDRALSLFDLVLAQLPDDPATLVSRGHALKTYGRTSDAIESYRRAYQVHKGHGDAFYGLANLKIYQFTDEEVDEMKSLMSQRELSYQDQFHILFALGKAMEDRGAYDEAFNFYEKGNALKRLKSRYDANQMSKELDAQKVHCTEKLFRRHAGAGYDAPDPIFIVGLPRAGSTLLEQILASHSQVDGTLELPNVLALTQGLRGRQQMAGQSGYPKNLIDLPSDKFAQMGQTYINETRIHRQGAPYFIDKMPNNFRHIGLIALMLPNAKIIDARRAPMDCCFSGFKQLFAEGQEFTYGLNEVGQYYRDYVDLMNHWDEVLPGKVLRVHHEDVLDDFEAQVQRILEYCGLSFESGCLEFHQTNRSVRTASSEQVRQPLNRSGMDQWRPFETHLSPLRDALGHALKTYRS